MRVCPPACSGCCAQQKQHKPTSEVCSGQHGQALLSCSKFSDKLAPDARPPASANACHAAHCFPSSACQVVWHSSTGWPLKRLPPACLGHTHMRKQCCWRCVLQHSITQPASAWKWPSSGPGLQPACMRWEPPMPLGICLFQALTVVGGHHMQDLLPRAATLPGSSFSVSQCPGHVRA